MEMNIEISMLCVVLFVSFISNGSKIKMY